MKRRQFLAVAAFALCAQRGLAHDPVQTAGQDHHDRPEDAIFKTTPLRGGVYALAGRGGNVGFVVGPEYVIVVDSQFADIAPGILRQVAKVSDKPVKFLVNTHHHGDHTGGNAAFKPVSVIVAHENVRRRMLKAPDDLIRDLPGRIEAAKKATQAPDRVKALEDQLTAAKAVRIEEIAAPIVTFEVGVKLHIGGETLHVIHTAPAHTDGDSFVYFEKANVLHMGDLFFNKTIPFIDTGSGGVAAGYLSALDQAIAYVPADVMVIPGHGEVTDAAGLKAFRQYIVDLLASAQAAKAAGKTREQYLAEADLPAYKDFSGYKDRFKTNAAAAWDGLK